MDQDSDNGNGNDNEETEIQVMEVFDKAVLSLLGRTSNKLKLRVKETFSPDEFFLHFKGMPLKSK